ncbi:MAG TPA: hypothetical protein VN516_05760, partial [Candidatus Baltobacteraceae bacterium]|nr:hypothetical protein [Candidatus Baltobacteraceae bacterium]
DSAGSAGATNAEWLQSESEKLATNPNCVDPLALTAIARNSINWFQSRDRFQRAVDTFPISEHKAYPKCYATVSLAQYFLDQPDRVQSLDRAALQLLRRCFADGSFTPADQQEIADIFVNGWGYQFFKRNAPAVCEMAHQAGPKYEWLALVLDGENEISEAWAARGGGYANSVTDAGWRGFREHLAAARKALTQAWNLHPDYPLAPCRMIYVSLGDSDITEMRLWFDRTTVAQIDYPRAWRDFRWGLRPRWYGNEAAMLALGKAALNTGRFDSDAPLEYLNCVYDVESEMQLPPGSHIFGRSDIWPNLKHLYEGYIAGPLPQFRNGWRNSYAIISFFADHYDVTRAQLEAL